MDTSDHDPNEAVGAAYSGSSTTPGEGTTIDNIVIEAERRTVRKSDFSDDKRNLLMRDWIRVISEYLTRNEYKLRVDERRDRELRLTSIHFEANSDGNCAIVGNISYRPINKSEKRPVAEIALNAQLLQNVPRNVNFGLRYVIEQYRNEKTSEDHLVRLFQQTA